MSEDIKPEVIKKTQDILGKFIKKPVLTEKLLRKPPFRFLHDICTSAMRETGFFEGALNEKEDKFENIKDKEGKILFLQKVIAAVEAANGGKLAVKPNKVVAGLEATKTNEFLQALGKALEKQQLDSKNTKSSQPGKTKSTKKTSKEVKEEPPDKKKHSVSRNSKRIVENGVHNLNDDVKDKPELSQNLTSPKKRHSGKKIEEVVPKVNDKNIEEIPEERTLNNGSIERTSTKKEDKSKKEKSITNGAGESKDVPDVDFIKVNGVNGQGDQNLNAREEVHSNGNTKRGHSGKHKHRRSSIHNAVDQPKISETENDENESTGSKKVEQVPENSTNDKINFLNKSESVLKEQNRSTPSPTGPINYSKKDMVREGTLISRPRTGIRPTTARPASARPAAPRIRDRGEVAVVEEVIKPASGKVQVIEDKESTNEAEDDNLISLETTNDIILEEPSPILPPTIPTTEQGEHGHLVEQILEVQRELEDDSRLHATNQKFTGKTEIEWDSGRNRESTNREIEKLRANIQTLTRSANPLGKLLDFFQEDVDTVQRELENWKEKNATLCVQIEHERSITDQYVEPLKIHLKELQQSIDEQLEQISVAKANIIRNNNKIHKLLTGM